KKQLGLIVLIMFASMPVVFALSEINEALPIPKNWTVLFKRMEDEYTDQVKVISRISGMGDYLFSLVIMALAPAFFEETFFRGGIQNLIQRTSRSPWIAVLITSIIFSASHFSYYGFLPRLALGVMLGLLYQYSGSLWLSIWAHFFNNAFIVTQLYRNTIKGIPFEETMNDKMPIWWSLIGIVALYFLFKKFREFALEDRNKLVPKEQIALEDQWLSQ
ncbi:MAG: CPBP family intramembrane glutamic endopeptidase, partial [Chitinophagaceae bacterium]